MTERHFPEERATNALSHHGGALPPLIEVKNLRVRFTGDLGTVYAVNGVDLELVAGRTLVVLGESGSGKSVMAQALMGVVPEPPGQVAVDRLLLEGRDLTKLSKIERRRTRGREMALIFQDALTSLNPRLTIGTQLTEILRFHLGMPRRVALERAVELLERVGIPSPRERLEAYPHQMSGGMRQRALIAMSVSLGPRLLIADEPTTALDVTVQAQVLDLIQKLQVSAGMGMILITHDLAVARWIADDVAVMYAGKIVEQASTERIFSRPAHPYTSGLMRSTPGTIARGQPLAPIPGSPPDMRKLPPGCPFRPRCPRAESVCAEVPPPRVELGGGQTSLCHFAGETR